MLRQLNAKDVVGLAMFGGSAEGESVRFARARREGECVYVEVNAITNKPI